MISKKQVLTILSGFVLVTTVSCQQLNTYTQDGMLYAQSIWNSIWPQGNATAAEEQLPPRPPKPKKVHREPPVYTVDSAIKSTTNLGVRRYQIDIMVPNKTPIYRLRYVFQMVLESYQPETDVIWMNIYHESQKDNKNNAFAKAQWFRASVPEYLRYKIIDKHDEVFHKIYIKYNSTSKTVPHY